MFTKILCATDGSEHAERALRYAAELAERERGELHLVHVNERHVAGRLAGEDLSLGEAELSDEIRTEADTISRDTGVEVAVHVVPGPAGRVAGRLAEIADDLDADLIVMGTHGRTLLGGFVAGSVTQRLMHATSRPVLALPPDRRLSQDRGNLEGVRADA